MPELPYLAFDADNHYYEAEDAFIRFMPKQLQRRAVQWAEVNGRKRLLVCGKVDRFIPNPTFDPVAKPGCLDQFFRGKNLGGLDMRQLFGDLEPIRPAYRDRDKRVKLLDAQRLEAVLLFPTQGVGIEQPMRRDPTLTCATLHAFNQWLDEDWGFSYLERLYAVPMISLADPDAALAELDWCLARDARMVNLRPAPVPTASGTRSPGDAIFDPFWARVNEAGISVAFHAGDSGYGKYAAAWGDGGPLKAFRTPVFGGVTQAGRAIYDTFAALIIHGVFQRFPNLRVVSVENGAEWVDMLLKKLVKAYGQSPKTFSEPPDETFRRHITISPYYEDDIRELADGIGVNNVVMGSDFPHAEGLPQPLDFLDDLEGFSDDALRRIMRENSLELIQPRSC